MRVYDHGRDPKLEVSDDVPPTRTHRGGDEPTDLHSLTKAELVALAEQKGVDSSGSKADLVGRLGGE